MPWLQKASIRTNLVPHPSSRGPREQVHVRGVVEGGKARTPRAPFCKAPSARPRVTRVSTFTLRDRLDRTTSIGTTRLRRFRSPRELLFLIGQFFVQNAHRAKV